jgi:radical SAM protein with 4Fe4S-binding SPASM domain
MTTSELTFYSGTKDKKVKMLSRGDVLDPLIDKFGERFRTYRSEWEKAGLGEGYLPEFPLFLDVEPEYKCNLRCVTCPHQDATKSPQYIKDRMSPEIFRKICEEGKRYGLPAISVSNNNEGLMEKYLTDYIEIAAENGVMDIFVGTNATLLTPELSEKLLTTSLTRLLVSIDAATPETYSTVRKSDKFELVVGNTRDFIELRNRQGKSLPLVRVAMVQTSLNLHEAEQFTEMWTDVADIISLQRYIPFLGDSNVEDYLIPRGREKSDFKVCSPLWQRMTIRANGDVIACCHLANKLKVGNVLETSIREIWHGEEMANLRRIHLAGDYAKIPICKSCIE